MRGQRSAGYGFVALASEEAAQKAVDALNKKELDGRPVIIEIAKPADQKERKERKLKRRPGRRGGKAVPGEVTEAEANGEAPKAEDAPAGTDEASKPKKKKKSAVRAAFIQMCIRTKLPLFSARLGPSPKELVKLNRRPTLRKMLPPMPPLPPRSCDANSRLPALPVRSVRTRLANPPKLCFLLPTSVSILTMRACPHCLPRLESTSFQLVLSAVAGVIQGKVRVMASLTSAVKRSKRKPLRSLGAKKSVAARLPSRLL